MSLKIHTRRTFIAAALLGALIGNASPYTPTIVFLVGKGNPKGIKDWSHLAAYAYRFIEYCSGALTETVVKNAVAPSRAGEI